MIINCKVDLNIIVLSEHNVLLASFVKLYFGYFFREQIKDKNSRTGIMFVHMSALLSPFGGYRWEICNIVNTVFLSNMKSRVIELVMYWPLIPYVSEHGVVIWLYSQDSTVVELLLCGECRVCDLSVKIKLMTEKKHNTPLWKGSERLGCHVLCFKHIIQCCSTMKGRLDPWYTKVPQVNDKTCRDFCIGLS